MCEGSVSFVVDRDGVERACGGREVLIGGRGGVTQGVNWEFIESF